MKKEQVNIFKIRDLKVNKADTFIVGGSSIYGSNLVLASVEN